MEYNLIFYGKQSEFLDDVRQEIESEDSVMVFCIEDIGEYSQSIGQMAGEDQKALTIFGQMKGMAECFEAGKDYFLRGSSLGILVAPQKPMHPLINKSGTHLEFFPESNGKEELKEKIEIFLSMGALSVDTPEAPIDSKSKGEFGGVKRFSSGADVIDTSSRQRIERLGFIVNDPVGRKKRMDEALRLAQGRQLKSVDLFPRKLLDIKNPSIDRRVDNYLGSGSVFHYTETSLSKDPSPIDLLDAKEEIYYPPDAGIMKYFPMFSEMMSEDRINGEVMRRLVSLVLKKEFSCEVEFYRVQDGKKVIPENKEVELEEELQEANSWPLEGPNWLDDSFKSKENRFTMPYYFDGSCNGFAVASFSDTLIDHAKSAAIEAILSACKGVYK